MSTLKLPARAVLGVWAGPLVGLACGAAMLWWSWGTWPDVFVDFGRELYVPWQLSEGQTLYADIAYINGPFSPYLNSLWFRLFGVSLRTLVVANCAILAGLAALLYWLFNVVAGRIAATAALVVFLTLFACGQLIGIGNYNFICPYSHELTHGLALSLGALGSLRWYQRSRRPFCLALAGLLLGLVFLTKAEVFVAALLALVTGVVTTLWAERPAGRRLLTLAGLWLGGMVAPVVLAFGLLALAMPTGQALRGTLGSWASLFTAQITSLPFYRDGMGLLDPAASMRALLSCVMWYVALFGPVAAVALLLRRPGAWRPFLAGAAFVVVGLGLGWYWRRIAWLEVGRPLPLVMLVAGVVCLTLFVRQRQNQQAAARNALRLSLVVLGGALLGKMILNVVLSHYGFALAMPAALLLVTSLVAWLPALIDRLGGYGGLFRAAALAAIMAAVAVHLALVNLWFGRKTQLVGRGADVFRTDGRGVAANWAIDAIEQHAAKDQTLAVLPEGAMLNYLTRRRNPTPYISFMPLELLLFGEDRILASFKQNPPDFVVLCHKDTSEYGYRFFGRDYGQKLYRWIRRNYRRVSLLGAQPLRDEHPGILLLQRASPG